MKPTQCDTCRKLFKDGDEFVDGKTAYGPWANMCLSCHKDHGGQLGLGLGQKYDWTSGKKIAG